MVAVSSSKHLPGLCLHDLMLLPIDRLRRFFDRMQLPVGDDAKGGDAQALKLLHEEITTRLQVPVRRGHWLPHARPPKPHAERWRSAAHQSHHGPGHQPRQHPVCAGRAQHWPAPARHAPHHRGHAAPARCRQHPGGGGTRPCRDARGRPHDRHGPRPRPPGRANCFRWHDNRPAPAPTRSPAPTWAGASMWASASSAW